MGLSRGEKDLLFHVWLHKKQDKATCISVIHKTIFSFNSSKFVLSFYVFIQHIHMLSVATTSKTSPPVGPSCCFQISSFKEEGEKQNKQTKKTNQTNEKNNRRQKWSDPRNTYRFINRTSHLYRVQLLFTIYSHYPPLSTQSNTHECQNMSNMHINIVDRLLWK